LAFFVRFAGIAELDVARASERWRSSEFERANGRSAGFDVVIDA